MNPTKTFTMASALLAGMITSTLAVDDDAEEKAPPAEPAADHQAAVQAAIEKVASAPNFTWTSSMTFGENSDRTFRGEGKAAKSGVLTYSAAFGDNQMTLFKVGEQGAMMGGDQDGWRSLAELQAERENRGQGGDRRRRGFGGRMLENLESPLVRAANLAGNTEGLGDADGAIKGKLTQDALREMATFGRRGRGGDQEPPEIVEADGTVTFWVEDGALTKYEVWSWITMNRNGEDRDFERTTTIEISGVGTSGFDVPADAVSKLGS